MERGVTITLAISHFLPCAEQKSKYFLNFSLIYLTPFNFEQNVSVISLFSEFLESFIFWNYFKLGCNRGI